MNRESVDPHRFERIAEWFARQHGDWIHDNKLISWTRKLGIVLNQDGKLDVDQLFHLFVIAILWNSVPTNEVKKGQEAFLSVKGTYTLTNFREAIVNNLLATTLEKVALNIGNKGIFNALWFTANGEIGRESVWSKIIRLLEYPDIGNRERDLDRLVRFYRVFNPKRYDGDAYLKVKIFLIFRELRIQFRDLGEYQYHPAICCVPDSRVRGALSTLGFNEVAHDDFDSMVRASELVANQFCNQRYDLYDLPLFFWSREGKPLIDSKP